MTRPTTLHSRTGTAAADVLVALLLAATLLVPLIGNLTSSRRHAAVMHGLALATLEAKRQTDLEAWRLQHHGPVAAGPGAQARPIRVQERPARELPGGDGGEATATPLAPGLHLLHGESRWGGGILGGHRATFERLVIDPALFVEGPAAGGSS